MLFIFSIKIGIGYFIGISLVFCFKTMILINVAPKVSWEFQIHWLYMFLSIFLEQHLQIFPAIYISGSTNETTLLRSNATLFSDGDHHQSQMLSFSSPKSESLLVDKASSNATLPFSYHQLSSNNRNAGTCICWGWNSNF